MKSHPVLKDKAINNDEIVMVDQKEEERRVQSHPKLGISNKDKDASS